MRNWDNLAEEYFVLANASPADADSIRALVGRAASYLPGDNAEALSWFTSALQHSPQKWFVAKVMAMAKPVPKTMLDPLLVAALLEPNPSATRVFVEPCVRGFGTAQVAARIAQLADTPGATENDGVQKVMYWMPQTSA